MSEAKTNVMRILEKAGIAYTPYQYDAGDGAIDGMSVAAKLSLPSEIIFKTLVTRGASREIYVFVIPVNRELNLKAAAKCAHEKSIEMIHVNEINKLTGYIRGGCSPIGMKKQYKTFIDDHAKDCETILVSAGKIGRQIRLSPFDLARLVECEFAGIAV